jgi:uncharacterized cupredoxin-like copper-binding protein
MTQVQITVTGVAGVTRKFTKMNDWLTAKLPTLQRDEAIQGSKLLIQLMPKQSGAMVQAVKVEPNKKDWAIVSRTPKGQQGYRGNVPYHIWYNAGKRGWYRGAKKSGEFRYYEKTAEFLNKEFPAKVMKDLNKVIQST